MGHEETASTWRIQYTDHARTVVDGLDTGDRRTVDTAVAEIVAADPYRMGHPSKETPDRRTVLKGLVYIRFWLSDDLRVLTVVDVWTVGRTPDPRTGTPDPQRPEPDKITTLKALVTLG